MLAGNYPMEYRSSLPIPTDYPLPGLCHKQGTQPNDEQRQIGLKRSGIYGVRVICIPRQLMSGFPWQIRADEVVSGQSSLNVCRGKVLITHHDFFKTSGVIIPVVDLQGNQNADDYKHDLTKRVAQETHGAALREGNLSSLVKESEHG